MHSGIIISRVPQQYKTATNFRQHTREDRQGLVREAIGQALAGPAVGAALSAAGAALVFHDEGELVEVLRSGITVSVPCHPTGDPGKRHEHSATFTSDGAVLTPNHAGADVEGEWLIGALGGGLPPCLVMAKALPAGTFVPSWVGTGRKNIDARFRPLFAAVAWAQEPDADWAYVREHHLCDFGVTPGVLRQWRRAGVDVPYATNFWRNRATLEQALPWVRAGQYSRSAAKLAAQGGDPDEYKAWMVARFTPASSGPWIRLGVSPEFARRLADETITASAWEHARERGISEQVLVEWVRAGITAGAVTRWHWSTDGDLAEASRWASLGVDPGAYRHLNGKSGTSAPAALLSFEEAVAWVSAGFPPAHLRLVPDAVAAWGATPAQWARFASKLRYIEHDGHARLALAHLRALVNGTK